MNISKKVLATVMSLTVALALVVGAVGSGANTDTTAKNDVTATNPVVDGSTAGIGVNTSTNTSAITVPDYLDSEKTYEIPVLSNNADNEVAIKKLIGVDYDAEGNEIEYYLGTAALFTAFAEDTVTIVGAPAANPADTEGRIAASTVLNNAGRSYTVKGSNSNGAADDGRAIIICENKNQQLIQIHPITAGEGVNSAIVASTVLGATDSDTASMLVAIDSVIDFEAEFAALRAKSAELAAIQSNTGKVDISYGTCKLYGYNEYINVFSLTEDQWNADVIRELKIYIPTGSYAVVNVAGENIDYFVKNGVSVHFFDDADNADNTSGTSIASSAQTADILAAKTHVLFNFYEATKFDTTEQIKGNILAPNAEVGGGGGHNYGQLIGKVVHIDVEQDSVAFTMPASYIDEADETVVKYTAHYVYLGTDGQYYEIANDSFMPPSAATGLADAYDVAEVMNVMTSAQAFANVHMGAVPYKQGNYRLVWEVYEDGKDIYSATEGSALLDADTYKAFTSKGEMAAGADYTFGASNVYFVARLLTDVELDVTFVDGNKTSGRPETLGVTLKDGSGNTLSTGEVVVDELAENDTSYLIGGTKYAADVTETIVFADLPVLDENGAVINYGTLLRDNTYTVEYTVPTNYTDHVITDSWSRVTGNDGTSTITYHIVLKRDYDTRFYIVDEDGKEIEVTDQYNFNGLNRLAGTTIDNMPTVTEDQINVPTDAYEVFWVDKKTGTIYQQGQNGYVVPARDVDLVAQIMLNEANQIRPRFAYDLVTYNGKYEIAGKTLYSRIQYDEQTVFYIGCDEETVKNDTEGKYYYLTLMTGAPQDVKSILFNISEEAYDENVAFTYRFNTSTDSETNEVVQNFYCFGKNTKESEAESYADLLAGDQYLNTYSGMVMYRFVLPADYATKPLYLSTYYDYEEPDTYWGRSEFVIADKWNVETADATVVE